MYGKEDVESMTAGFRVREQKFICGKDYATADTMQVDFFEITEQQHKASTRKKKKSWQAPLRRKRTICEKVDGI